MILLRLEAYPILLSKPAKKFESEGKTTTEEMYRSTRKEKHLTSRIIWLVEGILLQFFLVSFSGHPETRG